MRRRRAPADRGRSGAALPDLLRPAAERGAVAGTGVPGRRGAEGAAGPARRCRRAARVRPGGRELPARRHAHRRHRRPHRRLFQPHPRGDRARFGDTQVTYAVFLRRPVVSAPRLMLDWLAEVAAARGTFDIDVMHPGRRLGRRRRADPLYHRRSWPLADCETLFLQKLGPPCVAAHNAYQMCARTTESRLPGDGCAALRRGRDAGHDGLCRQRRQYRGARGRRARLRRHRHRYGGAFFGATRGRGTMPHALIGYAGSHPPRRRDVPRGLPGREPDRADDYFGREITDGLEVCRALPGPRRAGRLAGAARHAWRPLPRGARPGRELCRAGTPRAGRHPPLPQRRPNCAIWSAPASPPPRSGGCGRPWTRPGSTKVRIVASSGFGVEKCRVMADTKAPIDIVGTGSFIPATGTRPMPPPTSWPMATRCG